VVEGGEERSVALTCRVKRGPGGEKSDGRGSAVTTAGASGRCPNAPHGFKTGDGEPLMGAPPPHYTIGRQGQIRFEFKL
jgi:hypothetical protein